MNPILELQGIAKRFNGLEILCGVDLILKAGEVIAILGPSGAGKSTLLHISGLMEKPTSGEVVIEGRRTNAISEKEKAKERLNNIGFLFQFHHLLPDFNVLENVLMPSRLAGDPMMMKKEEANVLINRLGLANRLSHRPYELSGGEQQRLALARALIRNPKLLLCDEPTGNLDEHTAQEVLSLLWEEVANRHLSTIIVTHNEKLAKHANRSLYLSEGKLSEKALSPLLPLGK